MAMPSRVKFETLQEQDPSTVLLKGLLQKELSLHTKGLEERVSLTLGKALAKVLDERLSTDALFLGKSLQKVLDERIAEGVLNSVRDKFLEEVDSKVKELVDSKFKELMDTVKKIEVTVSAKNSQKHIHYDEYGRPSLIEERENS